MNCKICDTITKDYSVKKVLNRYDVNYYRCPFCNFIQTENPYWLNEAYSNAITKLDIGLVYRNEYLTPIVSTIINLFYNGKGPFLDYGGGYGLFVRMMRDRGFDFYRQDIYCENLFAKLFDLSDIQQEKKFGMVTAFEVFEHLKDPIEELSKILKYSDTILFTTELQPDDHSSLKEWWYIAPETGQHISLYSKKSLIAMADRFGLQLLSFRNVHMFSERKKSKLLYRIAFNRAFQKSFNSINKHESLLSKDYIKVEATIK